MPKLIAASMTLPSGDTIDFSYSEPMFGDLLDLAAKGGKFAGPVEADETYMGGKSKNMHASKRLNAGRGTVGKTAVAGVKDRPTGRVSAAVVRGTDRPTIQRFLSERMEPAAPIFTDEHPVYAGMPNHEAVRHSVGEFVRDQAHTNGMESFWAGLKRGYEGVYHHMSAKHLGRYVAEFEGRHNVRPLDTADQMAAMARGADDFASPNYWPTLSPGPLADVTGTK